MSPMDGRDELRGRFTRWIVITAKNAQKTICVLKKSNYKPCPLKKLMLQLWIRRYYLLVLRRIALISRNSVWLRRSGNFR